MARSGPMPPTPTVPVPEVLRTPWLAPLATTPSAPLPAAAPGRAEPDPSLAPAIAELHRIHGWCESEVCASPLPPVIFTIVPQGGRLAGSRFTPRCWRVGAAWVDEIAVGAELFAEPLTLVAWVLQACLEQAAAAAHPPARRRRYRRLKAGAKAIGLRITRTRGGRWASARLEPDLRQRVLTELRPNWAAFALVRDAPPAARRPQPPRWRCACPRPTWRVIRRVHFRARCQACGTVFVQQDPWPPPRPAPPAQAAFGRSLGGAVPQPRMPHSEGNSGTGEQWNGGTPFPLVNPRTPELPNPRTLSPSPVSGVEPGVSLVPVYHEYHRLIAYVRTKRFPPPHALQQTPQLVVQPQGHRKTPTWVTRAVWHGDGPPRPEIGIAAEALATPWVVYAGILHELAHLWLWEQDPDAPVRRYHDAAFRDTAERLGLIVARDGARGWAATSLSAELRQRLEDDFQPNLSAFAAFRPQRPPAPGLPRWECGCPIRLRGTWLAIHCQDCRSDFARVPDPDAEATSLASQLATARTPVHPNARTFLPLIPRPPPHAPVAP